MKHTLLLITMNRVIGKLAMKKTNKTLKRAVIDIGIGGTIAIVLYIMTSNLLISLLVGGVYFLYSLRALFD